MIAIRTKNYENIFKFGKLMQHTADFFRGHGVEDVV